MEGHPNFHEYFAKIFIEHCRIKFQWRDLSKDVIMDVGCGEEGNCGKAILEKFPVVGAIIFIDCNPKMISNFKLKAAAKMECAVANIEIRETLRNYAGKMDKVISTYVFHQLKEKEEAFRNVYHLLKPGGEAAVLFIKDSLLYKWLTELLKKPKWKTAYKKQYIENAFQSEFGADYYREMVEKIGFRVVDCKEEETVIPYPSDQECKDDLFKMAAGNFNVNSELHEEFKEDCFQNLLKLSARSKEGKPCYRSIVLSVLLTKPAEDCGSKAK